MAFLKCFQTVFLPQAEQSVILHTRERCHTVNISSRHLTYNIKGEKPSEAEGTFQICFWYFISFNIKSISLKYSKPIKRRLLLT